MKDKYKKQVQLLLDVLPEVAKEGCFAMHGGTAINLFYREMPRLSVDIDLTYVPIAERAESLTGINQALQRVQHNIQALRGSIALSLTGHSTTSRISLPLNGSSSILAISGKTTRPSGRHRSISWKPCSVCNR
ncbi:nucleotidyl transferase AbiEii/AbiGii toxin family protein [Erwinia sp. MYb535]|uniref:nucleotidyl transferase AbiEii/AbiGii toxin family protein n=1 Tax=Erwinia sp. MYb535 TaxID=2745309 RepID=UPI0030AF2A5E